VIVSLEHAAPLMQWQPLHIHHAASHVTGRSRCWKGRWRNWCLIHRCGWPITTVWCCAIFRLATLAGARVVTLNPPRRGKRKPEYLQWLSALENAQSDGDALALHLTRGR
jgi:selenocysteine-specific elongation factor